MAVSPALHDADAARGAPGTIGLFDHAIRLLVEHAGAADDAGGRWRFGPLVIISAAENAASLAIRSAAERRGIGAAGWIALDGRDLDRAIAAALAGGRLGRLADELTAGGLVVVDRLDRVHGATHRHGLVHLFDDAMAVGTPWCVSVPSLRDDEVGSAVAARLCGGLVVTAPPADLPVGTGAPPSIGRILRAAARLHDVPVESLPGPSRSRSVATARSLAMYLARRLTGRSLQSIGDACGGRDHTTVLHGVRVCGTRIASDPAYAAEVERISAALVHRGPQAADRRRSSVGSTALGRALANRRHGRRHGA